MENVLFAASSFMVLFILLLISAIAGRQYASWQRQRGVLKKLEVLSVTEGAVFALLGLLVAFTFTSAYERFEARKLHIIEEANAMDTAYLRIDLLASETQAGLRDAMRMYHAARVAVYDKLTTFDHAEKEAAAAKSLKEILWQKSVAACKATHDTAATMLFLPAINAMFDVAFTRSAITKIHPPYIIFILLIGLAALSSFLAGYSTGESKSFNAIYIISYAVITAFTIYVIIDLELPRYGLMTVKSFDKILTDVKDDFK